MLWCIFFILDQSNNKKKKSVNLSGTGNAPDANTYSVALDHEKDLDGETALIKSAYNGHVDVPIIYASKARNRLITLKGF